MRNHLGVVDWTQVANAATSISSAVQSGATAYTTVVNSLAKPSAAVQQYLNPTSTTQNGSSSSSSNNTLMYVALGGVGLLVVGAVAFAASAKSRKDRGYY